MDKKRYSIKFKTFIFTFLTVTLVLIISFSILYFTMPKYYLMQKENDIKKQSEILKESLLEDRTLLNTEETLKDFMSKTGYLVVCLDLDGNVINNLSFPVMLTKVIDEEEAPYSSVGKAKIVQQAGLSGRTSAGIIAENTTNGVIISSNAIAVTNSNNNIFIETLVDNKFIYKMYTSTTLQPIDEASKVILSLFPYVMIIGMILTAILSYFYSKKITSPIIKMSESATKMKNMEKNALSNIKTNDEIGELSENLDNLYIELCENIENLEIKVNQVNELESQKTDFLRATSHELKTPITALNGIVEGMIDNVGAYKNRDFYLEETKNLIDKMSLLVNEILVASKADENTIEEIEEIDIKELINEILDNQNFIITSKGLIINLNISELIIPSYKIRISHVLTNVISNAVNYTDENGVININLINSKNPYITIENETTNIDENELERIFEPFYTLDYSRNREKSGTGLGLYIVRKNLDSLKYNYSLDNSEIGVKFTIELFQID